jgi:CRP-like cAMP-binding protein
MATEQTLYQIEDGFKTKKIKKGTILLQQGDQSPYFFQVKSGFLITYVVSSQGKQCVINFAPENWVIGDLGSFIHGQDAIFNISAIEDSEVTFFDKRIVEALKYVDKEALWAEIDRSYNHLIANNKRLIQLLSYTAEERYLTFLETYPSLVARVPLKLIASYLGITPEALSRIRKKIMNK